MRKYFLSIISSTIIWYLVLYSCIAYLIKGMACANDLVVDNVDFGRYWPSPLPAGCTHSVGASITMSGFFYQLVFILLPAILILSVYGVRKLENKLKKQ